MKLNLPMPAESLIPHRPPMRLVDELVAWSEEGGEVTARVVAGSPFAAADGRLEAVALVELLAQAYATLHGYEDRCQGRPPKMGFLVGSRSVRIEKEVRVADELRVTIRTVAELEGFALAEGEVRRGEELIAAGALKLWIPPVAADGE